jgi:hypothetical protein
VLDAAAARALVMMWFSFARRQIAMPRNPFDAKYSKVEDADWETCASVLNAISVKELLSKAW